MKTSRLCTTLCAAAAFLFCAGYGAAGEGGAQIGRTLRHGIGGMLGEPTGASGKHYLGIEYPAAVDWAVGVGFIDDIAFHAHADALFEFKLVSNNDLDLRLFAGPGVRMRWRDENPFDDDEDDFDFGVRGVGGISFMPTDVPIEIFGEFGLGVDFINVKPTFEVAVGVRYYFR